MLWDTVISIRFRICHLWGCPAWAIESQNKPVWDIKNMNRDAIGAIGELIGSLAVVLTLAYLAVQNRQSGKATISTSTNHSRLAVTDVISAITANTDAVKAYTQGMHDRDSLEIPKHVRFDLIIFQQLRAIEAIFLEYQSGLTPKEVFEGQWRGEQSILRTNRYVQTIL
ncbi:MAG: hypothetical protein ACI9NT_001764 [Bacteroidia bacterium]|jgi:hypothetical protein